MACPTTRSDRLEGRFEGMSIVDSSWNGRHRRSRRSWQDLVWSLRVFAEVSELEGGVVSLETFSQHSTRSLFGGTHLLPRWHIARNSIWYYECFQSLLRLNCSWISNRCATFWPHILLSKHCHWIVDWDHAPTIAERMDPPWVSVHDRHLEMVMCGRLLMESCREPLMRGRWWGQTMQIQMREQQWWGYADPATSAILLVLACWDRDLPQSMQDVKVRLLTVNLEAPSCRRVDESSLASRLSIDRGVSPLAWIVLWLLF